MSKTYSVRGNRAIRSQQGPVTCSQVKRAIRSAAALRYDPVATLWLQVRPCPKRAPSYAELFILKLTVLLIDIQEHLSQVWVNSRMRWSEFVKLLWSIFGQQPWTNKAKSLITCNAGPYSDGKERPSRFCLQLLEIIVVMQQSNSVTKLHQMSRSAPLVSQLFFLFFFF